MCYDIFCGILGLQIDRDIVGTLEGEVALCIEVATCVVPRSHLQIDIAGQRHAPGRRDNSGFRQRHQTAALIIERALEDDRIEKGQIPACQRTLGTQLHRTGNGALHSQGSLAYEGVARVAQVAAEGCRAEHRFDHRARTRGVALKHIVMVAGIHQIDGRGVEWRRECHRGIAREVEHHALAVGVGGCLLHVEGCVFAFALPAQIRLEYGWQGRQGHAHAEIERCVGMLVVTACRAVAPVVGILLQAVDAVVGRHVGGVAHKTCAGIGILAGQDDLLAPVAGDVAHESRTRARAAVGGPVRLLRELHQTGLVQHLRNHHVGAPARTAGRRQLLAQQVAVPPHALEHRGDAAARTGVVGLLALAVVDIVIGETVEFISLTRGIDIHAGTASHVIDRGQVPFLDAFGSAGIVEQLSQEGTLLDGIDLHARTVWVDVTEDVAVAVADARALEPSREGVHRIAALYHLVASVTIHVGHTQLVEFSRPGALVVAAPGGGVVPVGRVTARPVIIPREYVVVVILVRTAVQTFHHERGMDAVEVADGEVAVHGGIAETHVFGAARAGVGVNAVGHLVVFQLAAGNLGTCLAVDD